MNHRGIAKGNVVELEEGAILPGTEVEVIVKKKSRAASKGSPQAILAILETPARCSAQEVGSLEKTINKGQRHVNFGGPFDRVPK